MKCDTCDKEFDTERGLSIHMGMEHPIYVNCAWCTKEIQVPPSRYERDERHYCNNFCRGKGRSKYHSGTDSELYSQKIVQCTYCDTEFSVQQYRDSDNFFCDSHCYGEWLKENRVGEEHPCWNGGSTHYMGEGWEELREFVIQRDFEQCRSCSKTRDEQKELYGIDLPVHHKIPRSIEHINEPWNLITLCSQCHRINENEIIV